MAARKKPTKPLTLPDPIDVELARITELASNLERAADISEPKWLAGMRRHYAAELNRLLSLKAAKQKQ